MDDDAASLVSILIPAYHERFFAGATDYAQVPEEVGARIRGQLRGIDEDIGRAMAEEAMAAPL